MKSKLLASIGVCAALLLCSEQAAAVTIDRVVYIQPIVITGIVAPYAAYADELDKIWSQAGIDISFLSPVNHNDSADVQIDISELTSAVPNQVPSFFAGFHGQNTDPLIINMWFNGRISAPGGFSVGGVSNGIYDSQGNFTYLNGIVISDDIFLNFEPDLFYVMAHEIGHNLGLDHVDLQSESCYTTPYNKNLMAACPGLDFSGLGTDIAPDGQGYFALTSSQIGRARLSAFSRDLVAVPEPGTLALLGFGLAGLGLSRRRKAA